MDSLMRCSLLLMFVSCVSADGHGKCDCIEPSGDGGKWEYSGDTAVGTVTYYGGCITSTDSPTESWCYVKDPTCIHAKVSTVPGEMRRWKSCDPCACRGDWMYQGTANTGCLPDAEFGAWCYTQGHHAYCSAAVPSLIEGEKKHWKNCDPCGCQNSWTYESVTQNGCFDDKEFGQKWCYVEGYSQCEEPIGIDSVVKGEARRYRICGREACADHKRRYKDSECCGSPTKLWPLQMVQGTL